MALIILTEPDPVESMTRLFKRFAYVIVPVSILFIKYYPALGRAFDGWSGLPVNSGITTNKNSLGCDCFILAFFFTWYILQVWQRERGTARRNELGLCVVFLVMTLWTLYEAHSSTSEGALVVGVSMLFFLGLKFLIRRRVTFYLVCLVSVIAAAQGAFGIQQAVIRALGRNETLTGRTEIWHALLNWDLNPVIGVGFESFWLGAREDKINAQFYGLILNEAHNGYLETYINLGLVGLFILAILILVTYFKSRQAYVTNFEFGRFRIAYLAAFLLYNWTEAAFRTHAVPFFLFFLIAIEYRARPVLAPAPAGPFEPETAPDQEFSGSGFPAPGVALTEEPGGGLAAGMGR
jgi:O-antigen ligase